MRHTESGNRSLDLFDSSTGQPAVQKRDMDVFVCCCDWLSTARVPLRLFEENDLLGVELCAANTFDAVLMARSRDLRRIR